MNPRTLIDHSSLSRRDRRIILTGDCYSIKINDKEREISLIIRLSPRNCTKLAKSEFKVTSLGIFKEGREDEKPSMCKLNIKLEEDK